MVDKKERPPVQLTPEMKARLQQMPPDFDRAQKALDGLKELGLDITELQDKIDWAKKAREMLLKNFV